MLLLRVALSRALCIVRGPDPVVSNPSGHHIEAYSVLVLYTNLVHWWLCMTLALLFLTWDNSYTGDTGGVIANRTSLLLGGIVLTLVAAVARRFSLQYVERE